MHFMSSNAVRSPRSYARISLLQIALLATLNRQFPSSVVAMGLMPSLSFVFFNGISAVLSVIHIVIGIVSASL